MNKRLSRLLQDWALRDWGPETEIFLDQDAVQYLGRKVYDDYEPSQFDRFEDRLDRWLHNVEDDGDQLTLFHLLSHLFFIGRAEFESLSRAAYHGPILRWLVEQLSVNIVDPDAMAVLNGGVERTWFCPITDSMRINSFLKVNQLSGKSHRPDWRSLRKFADAGKVLEFVATSGIDRIVLLEDFVGSGTQMRSVVRFAAGLSPDLQILVCPLVTCPAGNEVGLQLSEAYANVAYEAVMQIAPGMLIKPDPQPGEPPLFATVRDLITRVRERLSEPEPDPASQRYHGFKGTGAVVAMYSNCPNNTLPIIYDENGAWHALFPRIKRR